MLKFCSLFFLKSWILPQFFTFAVPLWDSFGFSSLQKVFCTQPKCGQLWADDVDGCANIFKIWLRMKVGTRRPPMYRRDYMSIVQCTGSRCQTLCKTWTHRQMGEVHHGHSAVHVSSVASFGRVVIFIPFVLTAVGNLSALRRAGESVWPTRSPIWIENPVCALTRVPVRSSCNWEWVSCPWFILLSQYDWASLLSPENGGKIEHFTLQASKSQYCMYAFSQGFSCDAPEAHALCCAQWDTGARVFRVLFRS